MRRNAVGWLGLVVVAMICVATSPVKEPRPPPTYPWGAQLYQKLELADGGLTQRYTAVFAASANVAGRPPSSIEVFGLGNPDVCPSDLDGGKVCPVIDVHFSDGGKQMPLFEGCAEGVRCEQTFAIEAVLLDGGLPARIEFWMQATVGDPSFLANSDPEKFFIAPQQ